MKHRALAEFWQLYQALPVSARRAADKQFALLKDDPRHPSLHFKRIGKLWSVRVSGDFRALALQQNDEFTWFWIGPHDAYDRLIG